MKFKPFSKKQLAVLCWWCKNSAHKNKDAIICDGAVRSGKSLCMFISFVCWAMESFDGCSFAICGKTVSSVKRNLIHPYLSIIGEIGYKTNFFPSRSELVVEKGKSSNSFFLFGGKDESSCALIQGMTLAGVLLDEVALMPRSFVEQALARCSVEGSKFWFNCNPENPAHWFYNEWIKKCEQKNALYLHFEMSENPSLSKKTISRYESLYSGAFYERFVKGKWVAADGLVYPFFSQDCKCDAVADCTKFYVSCDYGTVNPTSMGLWGLKEGVWYRLDEYYYSSKREGLQKTDGEYYEALKKLCSGKKITAVICDPSAASFITLIRKKGEFCCIPAKNDVVSGIRLVSDCLKNGRIKICNNCKDAIREFSLYRWDESAKNDCPKKENDHAMDDIRYFVSTVATKKENSKVAIATKR